MREYLVICFSKSATKTREGRAIRTTTAPSQRHRESATGDVAQFAQFAQFTQFRDSSLTSCPSFQFPVSRFAWVLPPILVSYMPLVRFHKLEKPWSASHTCCIHTLCRAETSISHTLHLRSTKKSAEATAVQHPWRASHHSSHCARKHASRNPSHHSYHRTRKQSKNYGCATSRRRLNTKIRRPSKPE